MSLWAVLPVKPLKLGKSRLSDILSEDERFLLNSTLLGNTLQALRNAKGIDQILVVSRDTTVLSVAHDFGVRTIQEEAVSNLNHALNLAVRVAMVGSAHGILIIPADIPLIETKFIEELVQQTQDDSQVVIVPDRREDGTNALYLSPPDIIPLQFGTGSFKKHLLLAKKRGLKSKVIRNSALGLDLDLPEDLEILGLDTAN